MNKEVIEQLEEIRAGLLRIDCDKHTDEVQEAINVALLLIFYFKRLLKGKENESDNLCDFNCGLHIRVLQST